MFHIIDECSLNDECLRYPFKVGIVWVMFQHNLQCFLYPFFCFVVYLHDPVTHKYTLSIQCKNQHLNICVLGCLFIEIVFRGDRIEHKKGF